MIMNLWKQLIGIILIALVVGMFAGCGGGDQHTLDPRASAAFTIKWPERTRLIPLACESINVEARKAGGIIIEKIVDRPANGGTSAVTLEQLPIGEITFTATAYPQAGAQGVAQATGAVTLTGQANQRLQISLTMASTIATVALSPTNPTVTVNGTRQLTATAKNAAGDVVLVPMTNAFTWTSSNTAKATVNSNGIVTGVSEGTATITATEKESGTSGTLQVTVQQLANTEVTFRTVSEISHTPLDVAWMVFQDGDDTWRAATRTGVGTYTGTVTDPAGRYGFAYAKTMPWGTHDVCVFYGTVGEITNIQHNVNDSDSSTNTVNINANATGLTDNESFVLWLDGNYISTQYAGNVPAGVYDQFACTYQNDQAKRLIRRNGVNITGNTTLSFDFSGAEAFNLTGPYTINITGQAAYGDVDLYTPRSAEAVELGTSYDGPTTALSYRGVPAAKMETGEGYNLEMETQYVFKRMLFATPQNLTVNMPTAMPGNCSIAYDTTTPYLRPTFSWETASSAIGYWYTIGGDTYFTDVYISAGWAEGRTSTTFPDFSGVAGWNPAWGMPDTAAIDWSEGGIDTSNHSLSDCGRAFWDGQLIDGLELTTYQPFDTENLSRAAKRSKAVSTHSHPLFGRQSAPRRR